MESKGNARLDFTELPHYCGFMGHSLIYYVKKKVKDYKCLTGLGTDGQNCGRTAGLLAFEGSLLRSFKQGVAQ